MRKMVIRRVVTHPGPARDFSQGEIPIFVFRRELKRGLNERSTQVPVVVSIRAVCPQF